jgi:hypothetical protein
MFGSASVCRPTELTADSRRLRYAAVRRSAKLLRENHRFNSALVIGRVSLNTIECCGTPVQCRGSCYGSHRARRTITLDHNVG